jgi:GDP-L-fucose synthase
MKNIFVAGHNGMVGSALCRILKKNKSINIITANREQLNLLNQSDVDIFFKENDIDEVYLAAAKVGGIYANNTFPYDFIYENLMVQCNVIRASQIQNIKKLLFLGSSCIYPRMSTQPIKETELLSGKLEPTNEAYAVAKISGILLCNSINKQYENFDYRSVMPTNLYGQGDNYHAENSHVIPALIRRAHEAKIENKENFEIWGSGMPKREFLYVDDMAKACIHTMNMDKNDFNKYAIDGFLNIGYGSDVTIKDLAYLIAAIVGYKGNIIFNTQKPDGTPVKLLDSSRIFSSGWEPTVDLEQGLIKTYNYFLEETK